MEPLQPFITGVPIETLSIPKDRAFNQINITRDLEYSVPQGKRFLMFSYQLWAVCIVAGNGAQTDLFKKNSSGATVQTIDTVSADTVNVGNIISVERTFQYPLEFNELDKILINASRGPGVSDAGGTAYGVLVDL